MKKILLIVMALPLTLFVKISFAQTSTIRVDLQKTDGEMRPIWAWFGNDEPNYSYMKDGRKLLTELAALSYVPVHMRTHNLLVTGDGTAALKWGSTNIYTEDSNGKPVYNWHIVDSIFDTYIKRGIKPLAQIGFMPKALSIHPEPYQHHWKPGDSYRNIETGWAYPPKDYKKWEELVYQWVRHCVERYGAPEVQSWYWEVWNEPDGAYWKASWKEFYKLYDYAAAGVKRALPSAKIGGPDVTGGGMKFFAGFINHCLKDTNYVTGRIGSPLDAVLFHAKGSPAVVEGHVRMSIRNQLVNVNENFKLIASYPQLKNIPVIIGESDPEGCAACGMATNPENAYRNGTLYSSYTAASLARIYQLAKRYDINLVGAVNWSFEFENQPWFAGYRDLATNGVDKPVLNVFRMLGMMQGKSVTVEDQRMYAVKTIIDSDIRKAPDVGALASVNTHSAAILVWNYHDADSVRINEQVNLLVSHIPATSVSVTRYLVDDTHSNSYEVWKKLGSPQQPTSSQIATLEKAGQLQTAGSQEKLKVEKGHVMLNTSLKGQAVELLKLSW